MEKLLLILALTIFSMTPFRINAQGNDDFEALMRRKRTTSNSSNYEITTIEVAAIVSSTNYSYSSSGSYVSFTPDYNSLGNTLATLQRRYDNNYDRVSREYTKLNNLELININNKKTLSDYKIAIFAYVDTKGKDINLGYDQNADWLINYICKPFHVPSIKEEIKMLQSINREINRLKREQPDTFHHSKRYQEITEALGKLQNCPTSEISQLVWNYGLQ